MRELIVCEVTRLHDKLLYTRLSVKDALGRLGMNPAEIDLDAAEAAVERLGLSVCVRCGFWRDRSLMDADGICEPCHEDDDQGGEA